MLWSTMGEKRAGNADICPKSAHLGKREVGCSSNLRELVSAYLPSLVKGKVLNQTNVFAPVWLSLQHVDTWVWYSRRTAKYRILDARTGRMNRACQQQLMSSPHSRSVLRSTSYQSTMSEALALHCMPWENHAHSREAAADLGKALALRPRDVALRKESAILRVGGSETILRL